jgi:hypothetical protein
MATPVQPKKPAGGAYGCYMNKHRADFQKQCPGQSVAAVSKLAGAKWKALPENEKAVYVKEYEVKKAAYEKDIADFIAAGGVKQKGVTALRAEKRKARQSKKAKTDPNRPKKPAGGAYGCYVSKHRAEFQKQCPGQSVAAVSKLAGAKWKALPESEKAVYEKEYEVKKAAYAKAMESYVPPAGAAGEEAAEGDEDDDENEDGEEEEAEGDEGSAPSPPKKAKMAPAGEDAEVMAQAKKENMHVKLKTLLQRPEIVSKKLSADAVFKALKSAQGKTIEAKKALLGA